MRIIRQYRAPDTAEASVGIHIRPQKEGVHTVTLSLPAGMDMAPDFWRFISEDAARGKFYAVCRQLESKGFAPVAITHL